MPKNIQTGLEFMDDKEISPPLSTYRIQFHYEFPLKKAHALIDYFQDLGISHIYSSPLLAARPKSLHGYDIIDPSKLNPEICSYDELKSFSEALKKHSMGMILDIVPNHMLISHPQNPWWQDVLQKGSQSEFAEYFDIDWSPARRILKGKILLPILFQSYGQALENQMIKLTLIKGEFFVEVSGLPLKTNLKSWNAVLIPLLEEVHKLFSTPSDAYIQLKEIVESITNNETFSQDFIQKTSDALDEVLQKHPKIQELLQAQLLHLNGEKGNKQSFIFLHNFLQNQFYRLSFWRIANYEINFRRFFDITEYAALCMEKQQVFEQSHQLIKKLCFAGIIQGLRIDHIDGLRNPRLYLEQLKNYCAPSYTVAEKILIDNEELPSNWPLEGTVGYDFLNQLNSLYFYLPYRKALIEIYQTFTDNRIKLEDLHYVCKKFILDNVLYSELYTLTRYLTQISENNPHSQDFTEEGLRKALTDIVAFLPVYRTYMESHMAVSESDHNYITQAVFKAKRKNAFNNTMLFDFIHDLLLHKFDKDQWKPFLGLIENFVMKFQQLTGPVMAKSIEDTAFYRYYPLLSLNEVGTSLRHQEHSLDFFHKRNLSRFEFWPFSMLATSTHDTKRSEDVRARLNVLSEIPKRWKNALIRWNRLNRKFKVNQEDESAPDANEEYLIYQTIIGAWPLTPMGKEEHSAFIERIKNCIQKSLKEAKIHTSWINPNEEHDQQINAFIESILKYDKKNLFLKNFKHFILNILPFGMLNSLSQIVLKLTAPGIPDIYQGNEIWDFSLVDPDNRHPVDYELRKKMLHEIKYQGDAFTHYLKNPESGHIKLLMTQTLLQYRKQYPDLFLEGVYLPLTVQGPLADHFIAFARIHKDKTLIVISGRYFTFLMKDFNTPMKETLWQEHSIELPLEFIGLRFKNLFSGKAMEVRNRTLSLQDCLSNFPLSVLAT